MSQKYCVITYGCQMNKSDSERIAGLLEEVGYKPVIKINEADLIVVNMCSVRQSAVDRVNGLLPKFQKLKIKNPKLKTILTGCFLKKDMEKLREKFDLILDIKDLPKLNAKLKTQNSKPQRKTKNSLNIDAKSIDDYSLNSEIYFHIQPKYSDKAMAYIPIMTGCNNFCSYCVVPYTRGREISRPAEEILKEARSLIKRGYKEIVLLGQNVNSYCSKVKSAPSKLLRNFTGQASQKSKLINFASLLKSINQIPGDFQISFLTSHPKDFSDELIEVIAGSKKIKKEIHLPVQSGDDQILKKMNRGYTREDYLNLIKKIREKILEVKISSDIIVGFPGETKKQFANTLALAKEANFSKIYIAKYSPRAGTAAFKLKDNVAREEKESRWKILNKILGK